MVTSTKRKGKGFIMEVTYTVYFSDGSSGIVTCEKPAGAHPDSPKALLAGITNAEITGKFVARIGRSMHVRGVLLDNTLETRDDVLRTYNESISPFPTLK